MACVQRQRRNCTRSSRSEPYHANRCPFSVPQHRINAALLRDCDHAALARRARGGTCTRSLAIGLEAEKLSLILITHGSLSTMDGTDGTKIAISVVSRRTGSAAISPICVPTGTEIFGTFKNGCYEIQSSKMH